MSSAICFYLDQSKILSSGNGLNGHVSQRSPQGRLGGGGAQSTMINTTVFAPNLSWLIDLSCWALTPL